MRTALRSLLSLTVLLALIVLSGCGETKTTSFAQSSSHSNSFESHQAGGITYHYYPSVEVYFDPSRNVYFWHASAYWGVGKRLPSTYKLSKSEMKTISLDTKTPYRFHEEIVDMYPNPNLQSVFATVPTDHE